MPHTAPIYKLHPDVLHEIFLNNTYRELINFLPSKSHLDLNLSPLTITRHSSQVCTTWRSILLQAPTIWARCIDLDALDQKSDKWRQLVLHRTGSDQVLLSITCLAREQRMTRGYSRTQPPTPLGAFLANLLHSHWIRIRELNISINRVDLQHERLLEAFQRPAPHLEVFVLRTELSVTSSVPSMKGYTMFSNHAPSLVRYSSPKLLWYSTNISSTFFAHHMRHLDLQSFLWTGPRELLNACLRMPRLEELKMHVASISRGTDVKEESLPRPDMPRLGLIQIDGASLTMHPLFLNRITPAEGCALRMLNNIYDTPSRTAIQSMLSVFRQYAQSFLDHHQDRPDFVDVTVVISATKFEFACYDGRFNYKVHLRVGGIDSDWDHLILAGIMDAVSDIKFPRTVCHLQLGSPPPNILDLNALSPHVVGVFSSLHHVTTLTLKYFDWSSTFSGIPGFNDVLFPSLKILVLNGVPINPEIKTRLVPLLTARCRSHSTSSIEHVKLSFSDYPPYVDLRPLDQITGLTVEWTEDGMLYQTYICGTDTAERLWLRRRIRKNDTL